MTLPPHKRKLTDNTLQFLTEPKPKISTKAKVKIKKVKVKVLLPREKSLVASDTPELSMADRGWINLHEMADYVGVSHPTIIRWKNRGRFAATWFVNCWRIEAEEAMRFKAELNTERRVAPEPYHKLVEAARKIREAGLLPPGLRLVIDRDPATVVGTPEHTNLLPPHLQPDRKIPYLSAADIDFEAEAEAASETSTIPSQPDFDPDDEGEYHNDNVD